MFAEHVELHRLHVRSAGTCGSIFLTSMHNSEIRENLRAVTSNSARRTISATPTDESLQGSLSKCLTALHRSWTKVAAKEGGAHTAPAETSTVGAEFSGGLHTKYAFSTEVAAASPRLRAFFMRIMTCKLCSIRDATIETGEFKVMDHSFPQGSTQYQHCEAKSSNISSAWKTPAQEDTLNFTNSDITGVVQLGL